MTWAVNCGILMTTMRWASIDSMAQISATLNSKAIFKELEDVDKTKRTNDLTVMTGPREDNKIIVCCQQMLLGACCRTIAKE
jgi:hypothetical protein